MSDNSLSGSDTEEPLVEKEIYNKSFQLKSLPNKLRNAQTEDEKEQILEWQYSVEDQIDDDDQCKSVVIKKHEEVNESVVIELEDITSILFLSRNTSSNRTPGRRNSDILYSAEVKDISWTQRCLESGASPEATCQQEKMSVCHLAAHFGVVGILREIITRRPDLFKRADSAGRTPLHYAAWEGHLDCLAILLGLQVGSLDGERIKSRNGPQSTAEIKINQDKLQCLNSTHGESVQSYNELCDSSHSCSSVTNALEMVWRSCTPLHNACARVQTDCALALLACGADITKHDAQGRTPLDVCGLAVKEAGKIAEIKIRSFVKIIEVFIEYGKHYNVNRDLWLTNQNGTSPLHVAVLLNSKKATKLLLDIKAVPWLLDENGQTPLHLAVLNKSTHILTALANSPSNTIKNYVDVLNQDEHTPLQLAILNQWSEGVSILLDANASIIDQSNRYRNSALHFAAHVGDLEIADKLIKKLPNKEWIDCKNTIEETPLFVAIKQGNASCVRCLLQEGASYNITLGGYTVLHKAIESGNLEILVTLLQIETIVDLLNKTDENKEMTPLHWAALIGRADCTEYLINKGVDVTLKDFNGHTALHIAAKEGHSDVIKLILKKDKCLANIKDKEGWLPFYRAAYHCQRETIELFLENGSNLADIVPNINKDPILQIIKSKMARPAEFFNNIFNNCITYPDDYNFDNPESKIVLNYSKIIPKPSESQPQMKAFAALFSPGSSSEIKKLILHPFIESFVLLKWKILQKLFYIILAVYCIFIVFFVEITIHMYQESYKNLFPAVVFQIKRYFLIALISAVMIMEIYFMQLSGLKKYFRRLEGKVKPCSLVMAFSILLFQTEIRLLFAFTHLLCLLEIPIMLSRFEEIGHYNQMFSKVALRVIKVFRFFGCFIIIGFSLIFWILMANDTFSSFWNSLIKTIVMMTSEFDYSDMMKDSILVNQVVVQLFFLVFLVCVPIVLMNLLLALAVTDVKDLKIEGKIERLMEQVAFLENMEILLRKNISKNIINFFFVKQNWNVQNKITVYPGISYKDKRNILPKHIIESILENLNERKKIFEKDKRLSKKMDKTEKSYMELRDIVNQISKDLQQFIKQN